VRDQFSKHYEDLLEGGYDCVDRIVLNAYFPMGVSEGGFRSWWRVLNGSDQGLDNAHLMRMAGRFSRRLRAWAKAHQIPVVDCTVGERKHEIAEEYLSTHELRTGLFMILVFRSPALVWDVRQPAPARSATLNPRSHGLMSITTIFRLWTRSGDISQSK
jgi:hypothetical protein